MAKPFTWDFEARNVTFKLRVFGKPGRGVHGLGGVDGWSWWCGVGKRHAWHGNHKNPG